MARPKPAIVAELVEPEQPLENADNLPSDSSEAVEVWTPFPRSRAELRMSWGRDQINSWLANIDAGQHPEAAGLAAGMRPGDVQKVLKFVENPEGMPDDRTLAAIVRAVRQRKAAAETMLVKLMLDNYPRDPKGPAFLLERVHGRIAAKSDSATPQVIVQVGVKLER